MKGKITVFIKLEFVNSILLRPCEFCGCLFLKSENCRSRKYCCNQDRLNDNSVMPDIGCLPPTLHTIVVDNIEHFARNSVSYNSVLSLGATGVENHTPDHPGWERIHGGKCLVYKINYITTTCFYIRSRSETTWPHISLRSADSLQRR